MSQFIRNTQTQYSSHDNHQAQQSNALLRGGMQRGKNVRRNEKFQRQYQTLTELQSEWFDIFP